MNKKQGSIEWLEKQLNAIREQGNIEIEKSIWQQAKAMHKEEIIEAWYESKLLSDYISSNQYYNKTFNQL